MKIMSPTHPTRHILNALLAGLNQYKRIVQRALGSKHQGEIDFRAGPRVTLGVL